ncbi:MAG: DNA polymerase IV, partial [Clostridia bacterium]
MDKVILHADLNNFYASVESLGHAEYKDIPLAVCGSVDERHGIV